MTPNGSEAPASSDTCGAVVALPSQETAGPDLVARQQSALLAFGRRANSGPEVSVLMSDLTVLVSEICELDSIGTGLVADGRALSLEVGQAGQEVEWLATARRELTLDPSCSMAAYALTMGVPVITTDLPKDDRFTDLFLRELGVTSAVTIPLVSKENRLGVIGLYAHASRDFSSQEIWFAETVGHMLSASIARAQMETELKYQATLTNALLEESSDAVIVVDIEGQVLALNHAAEELTGFSFRQISGRDFGSLLLPAEQIAAFQAALNQALNRAAPVPFQCSLVALDQHREEVGWLFTPIKPTCGHQPVLLLKGTRRPIAPGADTPPPAIPPGRRRRASPRYEFRCRQLIAPLLGDEMPSINEFVNVECRDISAGGMAFYLDQAPEFESLVVGLGRVPNLTYLKARIVRVQEEQRGTAKTYRVACCFNGRL